MSLINRSKMILCGDFNIDVSSAPSITSSPSPNNLLSQLSSDFCLSQVVSEPTRITNFTASTIDLVFLSSPELLSQFSFRLIQVIIIQSRSPSSYLPVTMPPIAPLKLSGITRRPMSVLPKNSWRVSHWLPNPRTLTFFGTVGLLLFCLSWEGVFLLNQFTSIVLSFGLIVTFDATSDSGNVSPSSERPNRSFFSELGFHTMWLKKVLVHHAHTEIQ